MTEQQIISMIEQCGTEKESNYTINLKKAIFQCSENEIKNSFYNIINDENNEIGIRFGAYYALFTYYRRFEMQYELIKLYDKYGKDFNSFMLNNVVVSQYNKLKYLHENDAQKRKELFLESLKYGQIAIDKLSGYNIGVYNNYAELVIAGLEKEDNLVKNYYIDKAIKYVNKAINIREKRRKQKPYSTYYCSLARLYEYKKNYSKALSYISKAISFEGTEDKDSLIRIGHYNNIQLEIKMKELLNKSNQQMEIINKRSEDVVQQINSMQKKYIELLAFFSSIIALIVTSVNIVLNANGYYQIAGLLMILASVMILAFIVLKFLINLNEGKKEIVRIVIAFVIASLLMILGLVIGK